MPYSVNTYEKMVDRNKYNQITINVSPYEAKQFKKLKDEHGLSARQVLELSGCPCDRCKGINVLTYDKTDGAPIEIPRGILTKRNR